MKSLRTSAFHMSQSLAVTLGILRESDASSGEDRQCVKFVFKKGSTKKSKFIPFREDQFQKGLVCMKANRK